jgi:hypothetical protein
LLLFPALSAKHPCSAKAARIRAGVGLVFIWRNGVGRNGFGGHNDARVIKWRWSSVIKNKFQGGVRSFED